MEDERTISSEDLRNSEGKIVLPENLQIEMMKFFMRTSIPRMAREREKALKAEQEKQQDNLA